MKKKKELKYLNRRFKKMRQQFKCFVQTESAVALHKFRVEVKKTRSFLTLMEAGNRNNKLLKTFKPVKKLFKQTGIIRDAQVHQKQAKENKIDASQLSKEQITLQQEETGRVVCSKHRHQHTIKKVKQQLRHRINAISNNKTEQFFIKQVGNTVQLLNSHTFNEQLHNGRKMLKHLLYNRNIIPYAVAKGMHLNFDEIDAMQQLIGDWHDNKLAIDFFSEKLLPETLEPMKQKQEALQKKIASKADSFARHNGL